MFLPHTTEKERQDLILVNKTIEELQVDPEKLGRHSSIKIYFKCPVCTKPKLLSKKRILDGKGLTHSGKCRKEFKSEGGKKARRNENPEYKNKRKDALRAKICKDGSKIIAKRQKTLVEKYGSKNLGEIKLIRDNISKGVSKAYEDKYDDIIKKRQETNFEKYGSANYLTSEQGSIEVKQKNQEKWGVDYPFQSPVFKQKIDKIIEKKYGVKNIRQHKDYKNLLKAWCEENPTKLFISNGEKELLTWIQTLYPSACKRRIEGREIDIFIEELQLGIEYNGLYWHREDLLGKRYHFNKTKFFEGKGIRIIHIWENEWLNRQKQVKSFLRSALGKNQIKLNPRNCTILWSDSLQEIKEAHQLLEENHIQGAPNRTKYVINVYYNKELVATATFGKHHRGKNEWILSRFCSKEDYTIRGLLGKLSKLAGNKLEETIVSWADYRLSQGNGYLKAGWRKEKLLPPDYFYCRNQQVISKQSRQKRFVNTPKGMTERQHAKIDGLERVWDCGKIRFTYDKS